MLDGMIGQVETDEEWISRISRINKSDELLYELVHLDEGIMGVGDPYFKDLYQTIINRAKALIYMSWHS